MNRTIVSLSVFFLVVACQVSAQTIDSLPHHNLGPHSARTSVFMQMSDGSLLDGLMLADEFSALYPLGYVFHKVSRNGTPHGGNLLEISDTLFFAFYEGLPWMLTAKDPDGDGNILAEFANDSGGDSCYLRIRHLDDGLNLDTTEVIVPLEHFLGISAEPGLMLDPLGDIILSYYDYYSNERYFVRVGLDGTVKLRKRIDTMEINSGSDGGPIVFSESPLRYCYWGLFMTPQQQETINCYLMDSTFEITNQYTLPMTSGYPDYLTFINDSFRTSMLGLDDGQFVEARSYRHYIDEKGVVVTRYDSTFNRLARRRFLSEPFLEYMDPNARPIGLERSEDGCIYFAYFTSGGSKYYGHYYGNISVVKMDEDLNIVWQRHCLEPEGCGRDWGQMMVLEDNSVAVTGLNTFTNANGTVDHTEVFYVIVNDDYDNLSEQQGITIRPYTYWPNPAQDQLRLQYSPDVQPKQVELYDMQGRLVRAQQSDWEHVDMQGLPAGQYLMKVTLEDGKVYSDKVVKE